MITISTLNFFSFVSMGTAFFSLVLAVHYLCQEKIKDKRPFVLPITCGITYILLQSSWMLAGWMDAENTVGVEFAWLLSELKNFTAIAILLYYYGRGRGNA